MALIDLTSNITSLSERLPQELSREYREAYKLVTGLQV